MGCGTMSADLGKKLTLRRIAADERVRWDDLVDASPHGTVFHTWAWVSAMAKHARMRLLGEEIKPDFHPLIAEYEGKDIGLVPLYQFKGRLLSYVFSPPPHTFVTYLGPCLNFPDNLNRSSWERLHRSFHNATDAYLTKMGTHCAIVRTPPGFDDARPYLWLGYSVTPLYNYIIDLRHPIEEVFQRSEPNFRNKVRRTEKEGYTTREGNWDDIVKLYSQMKTRYSDQGIPTMIGLEYLKDLWANFPLGRIRVFVLELNGEYVTASIEVCFKGRMLGWIGNTKSQSMAGSPNDLLVWEVIKKAMALGFVEYENIWANEERLNQFKTKLNPHLDNCYSVVRMSRALTLAYSAKKSLVGGKIWGAGL
jgi:hypothetical protein